jgi:hypothetical protein
MKLMNLRTFMFGRVTWTMPAPMIQKLMKRGGVGSEGEDLENVEADLKDLVTTK